MDIIKKLRDSKPSGLDGWQASGVVDDLHDKSSSYLELFPADLYKKIADNPKASYGMDLLDEGYFTHRMGNGSMLPVQNMDSGKPPLETAIEGAQILQKYLGEAQGNEVTRVVMNRIDSAIEAARGRSH